MDARLIWGDTTIIPDICLLSKGKKTSAKNKILFCYFFSVILQSIGPQSPCITDEVKCRMLDLILSTWESIGR